MPDLVYYHDNCDDGFCCAWLHWRHVDTDAELVPSRYGDAPPPPERLKGRDVYVYDFSWPREDMIGMAEAARTLSVLDHHKTAEEALAGLPFAVFASDLSGAGLVMHSLGSRGVTDNWLAAYVQDRDLWRFALEDSREVTAALGLYPRDLEVWERLYERGRDAMVPLGRTVLRHRERLVADAVTASHWMCVGEWVRAVNVSATRLISDTVGELAECGDTLFAAGVFITVAEDEVTPEYVYSLRSRGDFDVSAVARAHGGGGHRNAAGFTLPYLLPVAARNPLAGT